MNLKSRRRSQKPEAPLKALLALPLASMLAACAPSTRSAVPPLAPAAPESLLAPCDSPQRLPDKPLSAGEIVRFWGRDRLALAACAGRHEALGRYGRALARSPD